MDPHHVEAGVLVDDWTGLYKESWTGVIVPEAFAHPAKYSRALIRFIYQHVIDCGWIKPGDSVVDPFGGVALGGFDATQNGLHWIGCELEEKFVGLGNQNIALWNERFSRMPNWGTARLVQGDSRKLYEVLRDADCAVSSPPYATQFSTGGGDWEGYYDEEKRADVEERTGGKLGGGQLSGSARNYGQSEGQLGAMKEGDHSIAITSPPYNPPMSQDHNGTRGGQRGTTPSEPGAFVKYGNTEGQLEGMSMEGHTLAVSSPPYATGDSAGPESLRSRKDGAAARMFQVQGWREGGQISNGNLAAETPETFWSASRIILEQLFQVIIPGGHAVFVVKAFVRNKKIVDFPGQWAQLCEAVGFKLLHDHHALLTEHYGTQTTMHGEDKELTVARKSFFRRLAESKGSPRIDHENVLCFERPL